mgnify:CR=1 FL=1
MKINKYIVNFLFFIITFFIISKSNAHTFTGKIGYFDGLSHPVLGFDHFLAMVSVGIISSQIGGRAIFSIPATFVFIMIIAGFSGIYIETIDSKLEEQIIYLNENGILFYIIVNISIFIEFGIIFSIIFFGLSISINKKLPQNMIIFFVGLFGLFHGLAHGLEIPWAANPILFTLGFASGTAMLHIFGVIIGYLAIKNELSLILLKLSGICFTIYGFFLINSYL